MTFVLKGKDDRLPDMLRAIMACEGVYSYAVSCELPQATAGGRGGSGAAAGALLPALVGVWALAAAAADASISMTA
jgi:hypothetical protein